MRLTAAVLTLALASGSIAAYGGEGKGGDRLERLQQKLDLSDEQVTQMREIREAGGTRQEMHAVLTDEQRAKMKEMRQQRKKRGGGSLKRMQEHLDLSDEQVAEMREIRKNGGTREEMHAVLTDEQRRTLEAHRKARWDGKKPDDTE